MKINNFKKKLICWGASDQFEVLKPIVEDLGSQIDFLIDDTPDLKNPYPDDMEFLNGRVVFEKWAIGRDLSGFGFIIAIGNPYGYQRVRLHDYLKLFNIEPISICDKSAFVEKNVQLGEGFQLMKNSLVNIHTVAGKQCIFNTGSLVEHHGSLGNGVEIGPAAVLCGRVQLSDYVWIGAGSTILPRINVGENCIIGAGSVVAKSIESKNKVFVGNPSRFLKENLIIKELL